MARNKAASKLGFAVSFLLAGSCIAGGVPVEPAPGAGGFWSKCRSAFGWFKIFPVRTNEMETLGPKGAAHYAPTRWGQRLSCTQPDTERSIRKVDFLLYSDFRDNIREADNPEHADGSGTGLFGVPEPPPAP
jgi:hypothetical protein